MSAGLHRTVHRKATHTDQYLCYHSHYPASHKQAVVRTLMCREEALSSCAQEESLCYRLSREMGIPRVSYTSTSASSLIDRLYVTMGPVDLWLSPTSLNCPNPSVGSYPPAIQVTFHPFTTLRQELVHSKDPVPANDKCIVSRAECVSTYIGQMGRSLDHHLWEHHQALQNRDLGTSALAEHVFSNYQVGLSKAMVIDRGTFFISFLFLCF